MPEIKKRQYPGKLIPGILAIDQGTHASRATLYDLSGNALESVEKEIALNRISETEIEQDPDEILVSVKTVFQKILKNNPEKVNIQGIGIATQRSSLIAWNKAGNALSPVISWQDRRTRNEIQNIKLLNPDIESVVRRKTGLPLSPHYGASKFHWLLKHNVEVQKAVAVNNLRLGPLVSFLMYNLLDGQPFQVDHANASRTLLWNMETGEWDEDLLRLFGIDKKLLPKCKPVLADYGNWAGIPVKAVSGDQNAAVFSEGIPGEDMAIINIGSGAFILKPTESFIPHEKLLSGISCTDHHKMYYTLEGTVNGAATAINWAKEKIQENIDLDSAIKSSKTPILFINTVGGLGSPLWKSGPEPYWLDEPKTPEEALAAVAESIVFYSR
ncbi:MAG: FGGY family carbohydrate kinase [Spirochaetia bacterium]|nr:FGGY family carbohydrate kinase [Spirochaetia bacterium]